MSTLSSTDVPDNRLVLEPIHPYNTVHSTSLIYHTQPISKSVNKINTKEMQNHTPKDIIRERPIVTITY